MVINMGNEYGHDYIVVTDDDGDEFELEHLDTAEIDGEIYMAFIPADMDEDDEDYGMIILKVIYEDNEEVLSSIDDEDILKAVYEVFIDRLGDYED